MGYSLRPPTSRRLPTKGPPPRPFMKDDPSVHVGGDPGLVDALSHLRHAFDDLGEVLLDTWPGRLLVGAVDRLAEWLTRYDDEDPDRSHAFGLIAGWWSPEDSHEHKMARLNTLFDDRVEASGYRREPLPIPDDLPASILTMEPVGGPIRIALAGEVLDTASVKIARPGIAYEDLDEFREKLTAMIEQADRNILELPLPDENPIPEPPLRDTSETLPYRQRKVSS